MNDKTQELLQELADKLGTTIDHLWGILIQQAKYDVITSCIQMAIMAAFIITTIRLHFKFIKLKEVKDGSYLHKESVYSKYQELAVAPMILAGVASVILILFFLNGFNDLISAIFNPEYWALSRIMHFH